MARRAGWAIRVFNAKNNNTYDWIGNIDGNIHKRFKDNIVTFSGMYGVGDYMVWIAHDNIPSYDFSGAGFELKFFHRADPKMPYFQQRYKPVDVVYDDTNNKYKIYCRAESSSILDIRLLDLALRSVQIDKDRTGPELLEELLVDQRELLTEVKYFKRDKKAKDFKYRYFDIKMDWTVRDLIQYIAQINEYEWALVGRTLYIAREIPPDRNRTIFDKEEGIKDGEHYGEAPRFMVIEADPRAAEPLGHFQEKMRCIWAKHYVGKSGGLMQACFTRMGMGHLDRGLYVTTLQGDIEKREAHKILKNRKVQNHIELGSVLKDEGESKFMDQISTQRTTKKADIQYPNDVEFDRENIVNQREEICKMYEYLDDSAGLLFPKLQLDSRPPNSVLFNVNGRVESTIHGGFLPGNGTDELTLPTKDPEDFLLVLPNGCMLFNSPDGETIFRPYYDGYDATQRPTEDESSMQVYMDHATGRITINKDGSNLIEIDGTDINILADGNINIDGSATKLQGGSNPLARADHAHSGAPMQGNMGMPISGKSTPSDSNTSTTTAD